MIKVAIVDDHSVVRVGLKAIISLAADMTFVGECAGGAGAARLVRETQPDILLLDIRLPDKDGLDALKDILADNPAQRVIILTTSDADNDVYTALTLGAKGYLLKDRDSDDIARAIRTVAAGGTFIPEALRAVAAEHARMAALTPRERDVLNAVAAGYTNEEIAKALALSYDSVKIYTKRIFAKLGVHDRVNAVTEAIRRGLVKNV